ncbi:Imidazole glycerol phosphate synthase amidotransferase subunit protein [Minicystis rosea]|nr:Imidazole glycerol phosphate synthase amidotransferase subunit protein [Minicystis rosea]
MLTIALVDLGMGNLHSVERALARAGSDAGLACTVHRTSDPEAILRANKIVVPGQGAFRDCAAALTSGLGDALRSAIAAGKPYFGICLGLQALFAESEEAPGAAGLGVFPGKVARLSAGQGVKIPHMGWNHVTVLRPSAGALAAIPTDDAHFYFVHSYHAVPDDPSLVAAVTEHGSQRVTAAIQRDNVTATQFHPEKSQEAGLRLLAAFLSQPG